MAALMAAATIWESTVLTMSIFATIWLYARYMSMLMVEPMFQKAAAIIAAIKQNLNPCFWTTSSSPAAIICFFSHFWRRILVSGTQISFLPPLMPPLFIYSKSWKSGEHFHYLSFFLKISSLCCTDLLVISQLRQPQWLESEVAHQTTTQLAIVVSQIFLCLQECGRNLNESGF